MNFSKLAHLCLNSVRGLLRNSRRFVLLVVCFSILALPAGASSEEPGSDATFPGKYFEEYSAWAQWSTLPSDGQHETGKTYSKISISAWQTMGSSPNAIGQTVVVRMEEYIWDGEKLALLRWQFVPTSGQTFLYRKSASDASLSGTFQWERCWQTDAEGNCGYADLNITWKALPGEIINESGESPWSSFTRSHTIRREAVANGSLVDENLGSFSLGPSDEAVIYWGIYWDL